MGHIACLNIESGRTENLLGVLMKCKNYCDDGFIAAIHNLAKVWVAHTEYTISEKIKPEK
jgi:hypothetical protein